MSLDSRLKFSQAMNSLGLIPPKQIIADAKLHLCSFENDSQLSEDGWYIFCEKTPAMGLFGCWGIKRSQSWVRKKYVSMPADERSEYMDRLYAMRKERKKARKLILKSAYLEGNLDASIIKSIQPDQPENISKPQRDCEIKENINNDAFAKAIC